jgi:hypothetical protein
MIDSRLSLISQRRGNAHKAKSSGLITRSSLRLSFWSGLVQSSTRLATAISACHFVHAILSHLGITSPSTKMIGQRIRRLPADRKQGQERNDQLINNNKADKRFKGRGNERKERKWFGSWGKGSLGHSHGKVPLFLSLDSGLRSPRRPEARSSLHI